MVVMAAIVTKEWGKSNRPFPGFCRRIRGLTVAVCGLVCGSFTEHDMKHGFGKWGVAMVALGAVIFPRFGVAVAATTKPTTVAATTQARTQEQIVDDLNASGKELQEIMGSKGPQAFTDEKTRTGSLLAHRDYRW